MKNAHRPGRRFHQILISLQIALLVAAIPSTSFAEDDSAFMEAFTVGFDVAVLRTLGSVRLVVGMVALIPTTVLYTLKMPFDGDAGALRDVTQILVVEPANFVFRRPLGEDLSGE